MATAKKAPVATKKSTTAKPAPTAAAKAKKAAAPAAKKAAAVAPAAAKRAPNSAFMKPLTPSEKLAAVIGKAAMPRTEVTKKIWEYIKKHKLQDAADKRMINADAKLKEIFGKPQVSMFEMTKLVSGHLK
jgi:upstream activation factor subunit UAF30